MLEIQTEDGKVLYWDDTRQNGVILTPDGRRFFLHFGRILSAPDPIKRGMLAKFQAGTATQPGHLPLALQVILTEGVN